MEEEEETNEDRIVILNHITKNILCRVEERRVDVRRDENRRI